MNDLEVNLIWIPLFPLLGAVFNLLFGRALLSARWGERFGKEIVHLVAIAAVAFSCFFTFSLVFDLIYTRGYIFAQDVRLIDRVYGWIQSGETNVGFELLMDRLSAVMCMVITGVGLLIHIFSVGYMAKDPDYHRYFAYLNLFMASMLILVLGKSLVLLFVGWEGVGLCSYLLIGFWFTDDEKATAGRKAFITNRIGDFGFLLGMLIIYSLVGSFDFDAIKAACAAGENSDFVKLTIVGVPLATAATMLLFVGCTGKSAQIPLYVWLPDAMAGPTPVSALIHAATMVTAGVYLIVRLNFLFALAPVTMGVIAIVGGATALFAATIGVTQNDIKKVLAYSTVSQLGFMFIAAGMGAWAAAIFHLVTHAFFKACLFLGSGAVIEACHHNQDIRTMGGLRQKMPYTAGTFLVSCLAIAGIPIFSGFFSKDEILLRAFVSESVWSPGINIAVYALGVIAAFFTAFYMFRLYFLTFEGKFRGDHHTWSHYVKEYPIMSGPLVILAIAATFGGFLGYPHVFPGHEYLPHLFDEWLTPIVELSHSYTGEYFIGPRAEYTAAHEGVVETTPNRTVAATIELLLMAGSVVVAALGIFFAWTLYRHGPSEQASGWASRLRPLYSASLNKYWVDEIYSALILKPVRFLGGVSYQVSDQLIVDGVGVGGTAAAVGGLGTLVRIWHNGNVRRYLVVLLIGVGIVFASIYANPRVAEIGPSKVHERDLGGLYPTLGGRAEGSVNLFGVPIYEFKTEEPRRPPGVGERVEPPRAAPGKPGDAKPVEGADGGEG